MVAAAHSPSQSGRREQWSGAMWQWVGGVEGDDDKDARVWRLGSTSSHRWRRCAVPC